MYMVCLSENVIYLLPFLLLCGRKSQAQSLSSVTSQAEVTSPTLNNTWRRRSMTDKTYLTFDIYHILNIFLSMYKYNEIVN